MQRQYVVLYLDDFNRISLLRLALFPSSPFSIFFFSQEYLLLLRYAVEVSDIPSLKTLSP